ncbi:MAG: hypothetical protein GYA41_14100 [Bacteroidales bacterium]|nr:hypothetical protein [Bacteroidales bacterium]
MRTDYYNRSVNVSDYKISLAKLLEENRKKIEENRQKIDNQRKKSEIQKQEPTSFVCDWQTI